MLLTTGLQSVICSAFGTIKSSLPDDLELSYDATALGTDNS